MVAGPGTGRSATTLARVIGPVWAGYLFSVLGKDWPYYTGMAVMVGVAVLARRVPKAGAGDDPPAP